MKYDLFDQIINYLDSHGGYRLDNKEEMIRFLNSDNIPELNGLRVDKNSQTVDNYVHLVSSYGEKFIIKGEHNGVSIVSNDTPFAVSYDKVKCDLQYCVENDVIGVDYDNRDGRLFIGIYTDVLKDGKLMDDLKNLIPDTVQVIYMKHIKKNNETLKREFVLEHAGKEKVIQFPIDCGIFNIIRLVSNTIREEYRKNIGIDEVGKLK